MVVWRVFENKGRATSSSSGTSPEELRRQLERLFEKPPSKQRDGAIALICLELAQQLSGREAERYFVTGYSYARTSREPQARMLAERLRERSGTWSR